MRKVRAITIFSDATILQNGSATSGAISLEDVTPNGVFALHIKTQTGGTVTYTYSLCNTISGTYISPVGATAIKADNTTGVTDVAGFDPEVAKFMKIIATEQNVSAVTALTAEIAFQ